VYVKGASYTMCRSRVSRADNHSATVLLSMSRMLCEHDSVYVKGASDTVCTSRTS